MSDLAQQCEEIRNARDSGYYNFSNDVIYQEFDALLAYISELKAQSRSVVQSAQLEAALIRIDDHGDSWVSHAIRSALDQSEREKALVGEKLQRHEAANRNAIAIHMDTIERLQAEVDKWRGEYMAIIQDDGKVERALERCEQDRDALRADNARLAAANAEYTKRLKSNGDPAP